MGVADPLKHAHPDVLSYRIWSFQVKPYVSISRVIPQNLVALRPPWDGSVADLKHTLPLYVTTPQLVVLRQRM